MAVIIAYENEHYRLKMNIIVNGQSKRFFFKQKKINSSQYMTKKRTKTT